MAKKKIKAQSSSLLDAVIEGVKEKKGKNIVCLDLRKIKNAAFEHFVICEADSTTQVDAIAQSVKDEVKKLTGERAYHSEGFENKQWILIDYVTVIVHIFLPDVREYYKLESLWADAEVFIPSQQ